MPGDGVSVLAAEGPAAQFCSKFDEPRLGPFG